MAKENEIVLFETKKKMELYMKTEAVKAFLPLMVKRVGSEEVYGIRLLENVSSGRVLEKAADMLFG